MLVKPSAVATLAAVAVALSAHAARAQDAFEIQVYDVEVAPPGAPGFELHASYHAIDHAADELHTTIEPHYGLADWAELGGYLQSATTRGGVAYAGVKLRCKLRRPGRLWAGKLGLGVNVELSAVPARFEPNVYGSELRPIADLSAGRWYAAVNPIVAIDLRGALAGHPRLEPAAKLAVRLARGLAIGVEGYGAFGPVDQLGSERATRALAVIDVGGRWWDLDVGAGYAWGTTDHVIGKLIFGVHPAS